MPCSTYTWIPIDSTDEPEGPPPVNQVFYFENTGTIWSLNYAWNTSGPPLSPLYGPANLRMYYSTNTGSSWTEADSANRPGGTGTDWVISGSPYKVGTRLVIGYHKEVTATNNQWDIHLTDFNLTAGTWGTDVTGGPHCAFTDNKRYLYVCASDTTTYVLYNNKISGAHKIQWIKYNTAWSTASNVSGTETGVTKLPNGLLVDGSLAHFWFRSGGTGTVPTSLYHRALDFSVETLGAAQLVGTLNSITWDVSQHYTGPPVTFGTKLIVPYTKETTNTSTDTDNTGFEHIPAIFIGDPTGTQTPTWSSENVSSTSLSDWSGLHDSYSVAAVTDGTTLYVFWVTPQHIFAENSLNDLLYSTKTSGGAWSAPVTYFAPTVPTNPEWDDFLHNPSGIFLGGTDLFVIVERVNESFTSTYGNEYSYSGVLVCSTGGVVTYYTDFAAWRSDGNTPNFTY